MNIVYVHVPARYSNRWLAFLVDPGDEIAPFLKGDLPYPWDDDDDDPPGALIARGNSAREVRRRAKSALRQLKRLNKWRGDDV